jgi:hypothetical protein
MALEFPRLSLKERVDIIKSVSEEPDTLNFSQRLAIDLDFRDYCDVRGLAYCILNFLAYLKDTEIGRHVVKSLKKDIDKLPPL